MSEPLNIEGIQGHPLYKKSFEDDEYGGYYYFTFGPLDLLFDDPDEYGICDWRFGVDGEMLPNAIQPKTWHDLELLCRLAGKPIKNDVYDKMLAALKMCRNSFEADAQGPYELIDAAIGNSEPS